MQRLDATPTATGATAEPLISLGEAARRIGINKSTLSRQVKAGAVRSHGGKVRLSEVLEDRASNIDLTQSRRRPGKAPAAPKPESSPAPPDDTLDVDVVLLDGVMVPFAVAQRVKENYLARKRQLDYELARGALVNRAAAAKTFFDAARDIRDAWLSWPQRVTTLMAAELGLDERRLAESLTRHVNEHLAELGEPAAPEFAAPNR